MKHWIKKTMKTTVSISERSGTDASGYYTYSSAVDYNGRVAKNLVNTFDENGNAVTSSTQVYVDPSWTPSSHAKVTVAGVDHEKIIKIEEGQDINENTLFWKIYLE
jgi:hypothetical protein